MVPSKKKIYIKKMVPGHICNNGCYATAYSTTTTLTPPALPRHDFSYNATRILNPPPLLLPRNYYSYPATTTLNLPALLSPVTTTFILPPILSPVTTTLTPPPLLSPRHYYSHPATTTLIPPLYYSHPAITTFTSPPLLSSVTITLTPPPLRSPPTQRVTSSEMPAPALDGSQPTDSRAIFLSRAYLALMVRS